MEDLDSPWAGIDADSLHRVQDPAQAAIVADPHRSQFLRPFLGRDRTVTQASAEVGCTPNAMLYRVRRMHAIGLLEVVETRHRAGRPIKVYRSSHDGYFVPNEAMRYDDLRHRVASQGRALIEQLIDAYTAVLFRSGNSGRVLARDEADDVWSTDLPPAITGRDQPVFLADSVVWLTPDEAARIRHILATALPSGLNDPEPTTKITKQPYLVYRALLPMPDPPVRPTR